jgi:hypothetical protein
MPKKLEVVANIAIITLVVLLAVSLFRQHIYRAKANESGTELSQGKSVLAPAGYRWEQHSRTLLMALRYGCVHCERNMELYREIESKFGKGSAETQLLAIFPDDAFVAQHDIDEHGLHGLPFLANVDFDKLHVLGTPTLLLVDSRGTILRSWIGELSKQKQDEVLQVIQ